MDEVREHILLACRALFAPEQVAELRICGLHNREKEKAAGWYDDWRALVRDALANEPRCPQGTYITLNNVHPACLARTNNALQMAPEKATADRDIIRRHWLPIDIDPDHPSGVSSTDAELEAARKLAVQISGWLENELGFPPGLRAHSGNGLHLLYRIDLPNDKPSLGLVKGCISGLNERYGGDGLKVDLVNANAARIWKLYGTVARKGCHTADRPHRRSRLWPTHGTYPAFGDLGIVTPAQLEQLAAFGRLPPPPAQRSPIQVAAGKKRASKQRPRQTVAGDSEAYFDLDGWIHDNSIPIVKEEVWDGTGRRYILEQCLFDASHTGSSACLGRGRDGRIFYRCQHESCAAKRWEDAKALFAPAGQQRRKENGNDHGHGDKLSDNPWEWAKAILEGELTDADTGQVVVRRHRELFYLYDRARRGYRELSDDTVRVLVTRWMGDRIEKVTRNKINDALSCLGSMVTVPAELEIPFVSRVSPDSGCTQGDPKRYSRIVLRNGILDIDRIMAGEPVGDCLLPHTPEWFDVSALPFPFPTRPEQVEIPVWLRFLGEIFEGDESRIKLLQEAFGYCFFGDTSLEAFFVFHGRGRNGKSTLLAVLRELLGENNVSSLSPEQLADRFLVSQLHGKLANICADINEMDSVQEGIIKAAVTGDLVTCDRKYRDAMQFRPRAKLFFSCNRPPQFSDTSLGIWRRMILVPFTYICPLDHVDTHLFSKLECELPGIFLWALEGTMRLRDRRQFSASERCASAAREYRLSCFPILMFLEECTVSDSGATTASDLWNAYRRWGESCGLKKPKPLHRFIQDVTNFQPHIQYVRPEKAMEAHLLLHGISIVRELGTPTAGAEPSRWFEG